MAIKNVIILGSTGSIGINTLKVIERFPDRLKVVGLSAYNNCELLKSQIKKFKPTHVAVSKKYIKELRVQFGRSLKIVDAASSVEELVGLKHVDYVVIAIRGSAALRPFLKAVRCGKTVAPANKEALVIAGEIIMGEAKKYQARIIPIDSEQSAIFQCLAGQDRRELAKVYLTASGGPLLDVPRSRFDRYTVKQILRHPRWRMGKKITVDSATLMNKGFEVMEARWLFDLKIEEIKVVIHPEAVIHSMVEFRDGSIMAQLGVTDMRLPIQYALTYPERLTSGLPMMDFLKLKQLNFREPDYAKFPCLRLSIDVAKKGGSLPAVLNAADEEAVEAFLNNKVDLTKIYNIVEKVIAKHHHITRPTLKQILEVDTWAREEAKKFINN